MRALISILSRDSYLILNKTLVKKFGLEAAAMLSELISECSYWEKSKQLTNDGFFFSTMENIEESLNLSPYKQREIIKKFESCGVLRTELRGVPARRYFSISEEALSKVIVECDEEIPESKNLTSDVKPFNIRCETTEHLNVEPFNTNNTIDNINKDKSNKIKLKENSKESSKTKQSTQKTLEMLSKILEEYSFSDKLEELILEFYEWRSEQKDKITSTQLRAMLDNMAKHTENEVIKSINNSIMNGYKGIFFKDDPVSYSEYQLIEKMENYPWADPDELDNSPYVF